MSKRADTHPKFQPSPAALGALAALGAVTALLSLLLWAELLVARAGGATFCPLSDPDACARLWDGPFASAIHRFTGLPVAGWGVAWALVAAALPLVALVRAAESRPRAAWLSAVRIAAAGGVVAVFLLVAAALQAKSFCIGCFLTYALTFGYAGVALVGWRPLGLPQPGRALGLCTAALAAAFGLLLYPGLRTPLKGDTAGRASVIGVGGAGSSGGAPAASFQPAANDALSQFVAALAPEARQTLADSLYLYRNGIALPLGPPRTLLGPSSAPLRITDFTDIRCEFCADLHQTLAALEREAPAGSFAVEPRQFPLDAECNSSIRQSSDPVRCLAARARICAEGREGAPAYTARLFGQQAALTVDDVFTLAEGVMPRSELERCVASAETARKLQSDIELAVQYQIEGTPLVLLNGRMGTSFAPFLYAMILTGGHADHPAFDSLPPANPSAHIH
jgi:serine/threonine-protein kinase